MPCQKDGTYVASRDYECGGRHLMNVNFLLLTVGSKIEVELVLAPDALKPIQMVQKLLAEKILCVSGICLRSLCAALQHPARYIFASP